MVEARFESGNSSSPLGIRLVPRILCCSRLRHNFAVYYMGGNARISLAEFAYGNQARD